MVLNNKCRYQTRWAFSIVKTRGFAFNAHRNSTALIPLADFLNHHPQANVRTPDAVLKKPPKDISTTSFSGDDKPTPSSLSHFVALPEGHHISFKSSSPISQNDELCIEYTQASNLEFMIRYGFRVDSNPYGARPFDLEGEPLQAYCPSIILRHDLPEVVFNATVDCHRQARYLSWKQASGRDDKAGTESIPLEQKLRQDVEVYGAIQAACSDMLKKLETPKGSPKLVHYEKYSKDPITKALVNEIRIEKRLLIRCQEEFYKRRIERDKQSPVNEGVLGVAGKLASKIVKKYVGDAVAVGEGSGSENTNDEL